MHQPLVLGVLRFAAMKRLAPFALLALLSGCVEVQTSGIDGFTASSMVWEVQIDGNTRSHGFVVSSVADYCGKQQAAEQARIAAQDRHQQRLDEGEGLCASTDLLNDDLAEAYADLDKDGAKFLRVMIDREDATNSDTATAPEAGTFTQVGQAELGRFVGQLEYRHGSMTQGIADAYECETEEDPSQDLLDEFFAEEEPELQDLWTLSAGELVLEEGGDDAWEVDVTADLVDESESSVGDVQVAFTAERCDVEVAGE